MRLTLGVFVSAILLGGVAQAQTPAPAASDQKGYVEAFAQSAFGNVTSQSYGAEVGYTVRPQVRVFGEFGVVRNAAPPELGAAAQVIGSFLAQTQTNVSFTAREPITFGLAGIQYQLIPETERAKVQPYVMAGGGVARVKQDVTFSLGGTDITSSIEQYGIRLGTDLSGSTTNGMLTVGGGVMWPVWQALVLDFQYRYGRVFAEDGGINVNRAGIGFGVRF